MDSTNPSADRFEVSSITRDADGDVVYSTIPEADVSLTAVISSSHCRT
jgi:hypothetical protein